MNRICVIVLAFAFICDAKANKMPRLSCAGPQVGVWQGMGEVELLTLSASCEWEYRGAHGCRSHGTYPLAWHGEGKALVKIETVEGSGCLPIGLVECQYFVSGKNLAVNCGVGFSTYFRVKDASSFQANKSWKPRKVRNSAPALAQQGGR